MEYYFDTSSLVALARYYHPFDKTCVLYEFVRDNFMEKKIVVLDAILHETRSVSQGIALKAYPFIEENKDLIVNTQELTPYSSKKFDNMLNNNFSIPPLVREIGLENYSLMKQEYLNSGDGKLILTMFNKLHDDKEADVCIVSEESRFGNDRKVFKKIPAICDIVGTKCITLVDYLSQTPLQLAF